MRKETSDGSTYVKTTITKWSTHPPMQKRTNKKKQPNDYEVILPIRINRHTIQQKNHATNDE